MGFLFLNILTYGGAAAPSAPQLPASESEPSPAQRARRGPMEKICGGGACAPL